MNLRKSFAAGFLGVAAIVLAAQVPAENAYGQTKAEKKALKQKLAAMKEKLESQGCDVVGGPAETLAARVRNDQAKWSRIIRDKNITVQ